MDFLNLGLFLLLVVLHFNTTKPDGNAAVANLTKSKIIGVKGLKCFQCSSDSRDPLPKCDTGFWKLNTQKEKKDMLFQCPSKKAEYCVKKVMTGKHYTHTFRGCNGPADSVGTELRDGCTNLRSSKDITVCLCSSDRCNAVKTLGPIKVISITCFTLILTIQ